MAEGSVGTIKILVDKADLDSTMKQWEAMGIKTKQMFGGEVGGKQVSALVGEGTNEAIQKAQAALPTGTRFGATLGAEGDSVQNGSKNFFQRIGDSFQKNGKMAQLNKNLFMMQMASLGVAFSFQSIINSAMGLFSGLEDLGLMIATGALGTAYSELATGVPGTNIAEKMGVTTDMQEAAWAGFLAITSQLKATFDALATKVLTPEMVAAILAVIDALANELAKPVTVKAIQDIILAVLDLALAAIPLIPVIATLIAKLSESGLLGFFVLIIGAAMILLPLLAYIGFIMQFLGPVCLVLGYVLGALGVVAAYLGIPILAVAAIILILIDFFYNLFVNLGSGMNLLDAIISAFVQTLLDVYNVIAGVLNSLAGLLGIKERLPDLDYTLAGGFKEKSSTTTIINNYNKNVDANAASKLAQAQSQQASLQMG